MARVMTGGCQCGRVRYAAEVADGDAYLCHCRMCQRATGGVSIAFKNVPAEQVKWLSPPDWYVSSAIARRPFCSSCGTPLGFAFIKNAENIDLTVGSFDDPSPFRPRHHYAVESMHEAWIDTRDLPRMRSDENETVMERWEDAGVSAPE
jgi:hypothetical protein